MAHGRLSTIQIPAELKLTHPAAFALSITAKG